MCQPDDVDRSRIVTGSHSTEKRALARQLRQQLTPTERALWQAVHGNKLGIHIRRQQLIEGFCVDFYCHAAGLVIEVDGPVHETQQDADTEREAVFRGRGLRILRFTNEQVSHSLSDCLVRIQHAATLRQHTPPSLRGKGVGGLGR